MIPRFLLASLLCLSLAACSEPVAPPAPALVEASAAVTEPAPAPGPAEAPRSFDILIRNGTVYTGDGGEAVRADIAIDGDRIAAIGEINGSAETLIDASGLAVAPGFINMLSWATESLIENGLSQSDIRQGVTLEVMGEGWSMGPLNDSMKAEMRDRQADIKYEIEWTTLGEYLEYLSLIHI